MALLIRPAGSEDYEAVCGLYREADRLHAEHAPYMFTDGGPFPRTRAWFEATIAADEKTLLVAEEDGAIVGLVRLAELRSPEGPPFTPRRFVMVEELVVRSDHRRRGVGRQLMLRAEEWARARGIDQLDLSVWAFNGPAQALFSGLGYAPMYQRLRRVLTARAT